MEPNYKTLQIQIPEGYEIDKSKSTFKEIIFKKKDIKPRSWKEYCLLQRENEITGCVIDNDSTIYHVDWGYLYSDDANEWRNVLPSKEYAEAFIALMQLISLRKAWVGDWEPNWNNIIISKWVICFHKFAFTVFRSLVDKHALSFPTEEMANDFLECFRDLIGQAKILL